MPVTPQSAATLSTTTGHHGAVVDAVLQDAGIVQTVTKGGWCLGEGLSHVVSVNKRSLEAIVQQSGAPQVYDSINSNKCRHEKSGTNNAVADMNDPKSCFESLCRIITGQQLAGAAAQTVWRRLLETTKPGLTPGAVLQLAEKGLVDHLQKPAGLSGAKARSVLDLATKFHAGVLHESFLQTGSENAVREALLQVRGLGPWSCDMFLLFYLERPDVLPLGDLGVRKGIAKHFGMRGSGKQGSLCQKKDFDKIVKAVAPFAPYRSLFTYYMWKVADIKDVHSTDDSPKKKATEKAATIVTPAKPNKKAKP
jgi:DNA-3-methyladenine glycosylase II